MRLKSILAISVFLLGCGLISNSEASVTIQENGLVAYYKFEGNAEDSSGLNNVGSEHGGLTYVYGKYGKAAFFDGNDDFIKIPNSSSLNPGDALTISVWVKTSHRTHTGRILDKMGAISGQGYRLYTWNTPSNGYIFDVCTTNNWWQEAEIVDQTSDKWTMVTATYDGNEARIYLDGVLVDVEPTSGPILNSSSDVYLGCRPDQAYFFDGLMDELRVYNRSLSPSEVQTLYQHNGFTKTELDGDGRFISYNDGTVVDTMTNLMWSSIDNGYDITYSDAIAYAESSTLAGHTDWRLATQDELAALFSYSKTQSAECDTQYVNHVVTDLIHLTCFNPWASETDGLFAAGYSFPFGNGRRWWDLNGTTAGESNRALLVRQNLTTLAEVGGRIAFVSDRNGSQGLWTMNLTTGETKLIVSGAENGWRYVDAPRWNSTGKKIFFAAYDSTWNIWAIKSDGSELQKLTSPFGSYFLNPSASPINPDVVFYQKIVPAWTSEVYRLDTLTGIEERIPNSSGRNTQYFDVMDDEVGILFSREPGCCWTPTMYTGYQDMLGGAEQIIKPADGLAEWVGRINRLDHWIAYHQASGYTPPVNVFKMDENGANVTQLTFATGGDAFFFPVWAGGDNTGYLIMSGRISGNDEIYALSPSGTLVNLTSSPAFDYKPDWTPTTGENHAPEFAPLGAQSVELGESLTFKVIASDQDGDDVTITSGVLPSGASFGTDNVFSWTPNYTQAGNYIVDFTAKDNGTPSKTDAINVSISVSVPAPDVIIERLIDIINAPEVPKEVKNALGANLNNAMKFIDTNKTGPATNQINATITKAGEFANAGTISLEFKQLIIDMCLAALKGLNP